MYTLRYNGRIWKSGSFDICIKELRRIFPKRATVQSAVAAGWTIKCEVA